MKHAILVVVLFTFCASFVGSTVTRFKKQVFDQIRGFFGGNEDNITEEVTFFLYTHTKRDGAGEQFWIDDDESIARSSFNASLLTKFVIHGWTNNHTTDMSQTVKNAFLDQDDYNVITVDWGKIAAESYPLAVADLKKVGDYIGKMIMYLKNDYLNLKNLTIVGHSLGAHVAGLAAKYVIETANEKVLHLVGLDPANPGFEIIASNLRIGADDADLVEIVHTNNGVKGLFQPLGHLDFYPNGLGPGQPGCGIDLEGSCAHARSFRYYAEALTRPSAWVGLKCSSFAQFLMYGCQGNEIASFPLWTANFTRPRGSYVLITDSEEPFGLGLNGTDPNTYFELF